MSISRFDISPTALSITSLQRHHLDTEFGSAATEQGPTYLSLPSIFDPLFSIDLCVFNISSKVNFYGNDLELNDSLVHTWQS